LRQRLFYFYIFHIHNRIYAFAACCLMIAMTVSMLSLAAILLGRS
jgi:hypothetical protein